MMFARFGEVKQTDKRSMGVIFHSVNVLNTRLANFN
jgi:hypothetical protein